MRKALCAILALLLLPLAGYAAEPWRDALGNPLGDFTAECADGTRFSLSETLKEKELVAISLFASWCEPCRAELSCLQAAQEAYPDALQVVGLSMDRTNDTDEALLAFAAENSLTFPLGRDPVRLSLELGIKAMPALILVDRFGSVVHIETGAPSDAAWYQTLFGQFLGDAYTRTRIPLLEGEE